MGNCPRRMCRHPARRPVGGTDPLFFRKGRGDALCQLFLSFPVSSKCLTSLRKNKIWRKAALFNWKARVWLMCLHWAPPGSSAATVDYPEKEGTEQWGSECGRLLLKTHGIGNHIKIPELWKQSLYRNTGLKT